MSAAIHHHVKSECQEDTGNQAPKKRTSDKEQTRRTVDETAKGITWGIMEFFRGCRRKGYNDTKNKPITRIFSSLLSSRILERKVIQDVQDNIKPL
jgi:hypothetical protein